jgi:uncharacterized protein (TIGR04255 family)
VNSGASSWVCPGVIHDNPGGFVAEVSSTPKFRFPPVIETLLSVQFAQLEKFSIPYFGLFWSEIRDAYPAQEVQPPVGQEVEQFGQPPGPLTLNLALVQEPLARCWFISREGDQLIQVQRDRFIRNWRKRPETPEYPEYHVLRPRFEADWLRFVQFLEREGIGRPDVNQCEVTYINHLPAGDGWESFGNLDGVLKMIRSPAGVFLPEPEILLLNARYVMHDKQGRLHVTLNPAIRQHDGQRVLQLTLTARGRPASASHADVMAWLDLGHDWVVSGFTDLTTQSMHDRWERYR